MMRYLSQKMKRLESFVAGLSWLYTCLGAMLFLPGFLSDVAASIDKVPIKALAIPLADHYAGIVAYEKYKDVMQHADYQIKILNGPHLVRAYFTSEPDADIAFNVCPMVMAMFDEKPDFKWVSLIHRDGNALAVNRVMRQKIRLSDDKKLRKPDDQIAKAFHS